MRNDDDDVYFAGRGAVFGNGPWQAKVAWLIVKRVS